jgi:hypothetical protein
MKVDTPETAQEPSDQTTNYDKQTLSRAEDTPLQFVGTELGSAKKSRRENDWTHEIAIYLTKKGKFVGEKFTDANYMEKAERDAAAFKEAKDLISWLRNEANGGLSECALAALKKAAAKNTRIADAFCEVIE